MLQLVIVTVLLFVLFFGLGFILNMLMKTTWFPIYGYIALVIFLVVYWGWGTDSLTTNLTEYGIADYVPAVGGLIGAALSGSTIKALRTKGYRMF
ncbi:MULTISPECIES: YuiB family protein [Paenibacillus]|uniref:YuiB family protein n=1 Tax=Paenibacillus radicis (ex Xue et al. 2023) TaxID=2972489 RepID=A0ABT1Y9L5_9BACL|nr:YuiB family protein [Paenibacillus radicis (ex Xue et al. 2023)]MCR8629872.1 YuiB family protein [Paenibacillus radicis (ex Xue et al. 2023)]